MDGLPSGAGEGGLQPVLEEKKLQVPAGPVEVSGGRERVGSGSPGSLIQDGAAS